MWHSSDMRRAANNKLWQRLESRLIEMKERRKRLLQNIYLREKNQDSSNLPKIIDAGSLAKDSPGIAGKGSQEEGVQTGYSLDF